MKFKIIFSLICTIAFSLQVPAHAATIILTDNKISALHGVMVNGVAYNVTTHNSFEETSAAVYDYKFSQTASRALYNLFTFGKLAKTQYDRNPTTTNGCTYLRNCMWATVYANDGNQLSSYAFMNYNPDYKLKNTNYSYPINLSNDGYTAVTTYLQWTKATQSISCTGFEVPLDAVDFKSASKAFSLKAIVQDKNGAITRGMLRTPPVIAVTYFSAPEADPVDVSDKVFSVRFADAGKQFFFSDGIWEYILSTKNYTNPGTYKMFMASGDLSEYNFNEPACIASFVVSADKKSGKNAKDRVRKK